MTDELIGQWLLVYQTLSEQLSYTNAPRPFKNPAYNKNVNRRAKNVKNVLAQERERERQERERRRQLKEEKMDIDGDVTKQQADLLEEDLPSCSSYFRLFDEFGWR